jgi:hypothetical protein
MIGSRSKELKAVDAALADYHRRPDVFATCHLARCIIAWAAKTGLKSNGDLNTRRSQAPIRQLISDVRNLDGGEVLHDFRGAVQRARAQGYVAFSYAGEWIKAVKHRLDRMKQFACMDAFANCPRAGGQPPVDWNLGFAGCINPARRMQVMQRHDAYNASNRRAGLQMPPNRNFGWDANLGMCRSTRQKTYAAQAGLCTSFAMAAMDILTENRQPGPRIEMVAYNLHVFVIVGRAANITHNGGRLPPYQAWGNDWWIVDGWAGAMGYEVVYEGATGYPYPGMLNVRQIMHRDPS